MLIFFRRGKVTPKAVLHPVGGLRDAPMHGSHPANLKETRMPHFRLAMAASLAALLAVPALARADGPLDAYLPKSGVIEGHVMTLGVAPEDQAIDRQFRNAVANNMDWFKKAVTGSKAGEPLPYDPRMGITKAQYQQLQHMKADFHPGAPITIKVTRAKDGAIAFASDNPAASELDKVSFPAGETSADTPFGKLDLFNRIHQEDARAPIGVWTGAEWAHVAPEGAKTPSAKIAFGKRDPSGEGVMYYQVAPYSGHKEQSLVVFYKLD